MRDRQDHDKAGLQRPIAGGDETGRAVLTLVAADRGLPQPPVIVSDNKAGLRLRHRHARRSLHQLVERRMLTVHLGAFDSLDHDRRRVSGPMGPSGGCHEPVIMIGRQQHELPPPPMWRGNSRLMGADEEGTPRDSSDRRPRAAGIDKSGLIAYKLRYCLSSLDRSEGVTRRCGSAGLVSLLRPSGLPQEGADLHRELVRKSLLSLNFWRRIRHC